jgi:hypothetical protein
VRADRGRKAGSAFHFTGVTASGVPLLELIQPDAVSLHRFVLLATLGLFFVSPTLPFDRPAPLGRPRCRVARRRWPTIKPSRRAAASTACAETLDGACCYREMRLQEVGRKGRDRLVPTTRAGAPWPGLPQYHREGANRSNLFSYLCRRIVDLHKPGQLGGRYGSLDFWSVFYQPWH